LELDWISPLGPKSNSPILGIGQCPIPTLYEYNIGIYQYTRNPDKKVALKCIRSSQNFIDEFLNEV